MTTKSIELEEKAIETQIRERRENYLLNIVKYVIWSNIFCIVGASIAWLFLPQYTQLLVFAGDVVPLTVAAVLYPALHRRGQAKAGAYLFLGSALLVIFTIPLIIPEMMIVVAPAYVTLAIVSYLSLGPRDGRWVVGASILLFVVDAILVYLVSVSWFTPLSETTSQVIGTFVAAQVILIASILVYRSVSEQEQYFGQSKLANWKVEVANRTLEAQVWQTTGQAQLNEQMQGEQDMETLANSVIHQLCPGWHAVHRRRSQPPPGRRLRL
jgi:hypothetical protein